MQDLAQCSRRLFDRRIAGDGLGAIRRLSDEFDIYSQPGKGTAVLARLRPRRRDRCAIAGRSRWPASRSPCPARRCAATPGASSPTRPRADGVADGLGHGLHAAAAAAAADRGVFRAALTATSARNSDGDARRAAAYARRRRGRWRRSSRDGTVITFAGVGNIARRPSSRTARAPCRLAQRHARARVAHVPRVSAIPGRTARFS